MGYCKLPLLMGGGGIDLDNVKSLTKTTTGYTWGQSHSVTINGTLLSLSFGNYQYYYFANGKATLKNGTLVPVTLSTVNLKNVVNLSFSIGSNNAVNGAGVVGVCYLPD